MVERRRHQRISCILEATLESGEKVRFLPMKLARVTNISRNGLSMHSAERFEVGTRLTMRLRSGERQVGPVEVRVRHATEEPNGTWIMGGEFSSELSEAVVGFIVSE